MHTTDVNVFVDCIETFSVSINWRVLFHQIATILYSMEESKSFCNSLITNRYCPFGLGDIYIYI